MAAVRRILWQSWRRKTHESLIAQQSCTRLANNIRCSSSFQKGGRHEDDSAELNQKSAIMKAAEERRRKYDTLIQSEREAYERGRRHLANMMGEDPTTFTQTDIDNAIAYLLPSGLTEKKARPMMKPPEEYYPAMKAGQFGPDGRPLHSLFYTNNPQYYELMHKTYKELQRLLEMEDKKIAQGILIPEADTIDLSRSVWITQVELEAYCIESITDEQYQRFTALLERITMQPYAKEAEEYIWRFRTRLEAVQQRQIEPILYDESGRGFSIGHGTRKNARADVTIRDQGSGKVTVNGDEFVKHFALLQDRIQILFPFHFLDMMERFDVEATVTGGGPAGQAGAIRYGICLALARCFVDEHQMEQMRQAGLLTRDPRIRERKKPGRKRARKKFTWKKR